MAKPFIQLIDAAQQLPFDVSQARTIPFDIHDLDSVEDCRGSLSRHIEAIKRDPTAKVETPLGRAIELQSLRTSGDPVQEGTAHILERLSRIEKRLSPGITRLDEAMLAALGRAPQSSTPLKTRMHQLEDAMIYDLWTARMKERRNAASQHTNPPEPQIEKSPSEPVEEQDD